MLISSTPIELDLADDWNFKKLPQRNQELHRWAMSLPLIRPTPEMAAECNSEIGNATLAAMPLEVISTRNSSPNYDRLQQRLLALSSNSKQIVAENSSHMVIVDQPEVVIDAIRDVVETARHPTTASALP